MFIRLKTAGPVAYLFIGAASAAAGLLPWLVAGMRLPLQNLWAAGTLPADMPRTRLPASTFPGWSPALRRRSCSDCWCSC